MVQTKFTINYRYILSRCNARTLLLVDDKVDNTYADLLIIARLCLGKDFSDFFGFMWAEIFNGVKTFHPMCEQ
jgi:hypothetical protein